MKSICPERIKDGRCYTQAHDDAGGVDKQAGRKLAFNHDLFMVVNFLIKAFQIPFLLIGGADLPHIFQRLLDAVGNPDSGFFRPLGGAGSHPSAAEQQPKGHRHAPQAGNRQPPVVDKQADGDDRRRDVCAVQIPQHMAPDVLHAVDVPHEGLGQIGQIPLAEVAQGQLAQPFRKTQAGGFDLAVHQPVGGLVLLQMGKKG